MNQEKDENSISPCPVPNGILVIVGGHENKGEEPEKEVQQGEYKPLEILREFVRLTDIKDCIIEVITSASSEGDESFEDYRKAFTELEVAHIGHIHHDKRADVLKDTEALDRIKKAHGVYFAGGDQLKLTSVYGGTGLLSQLKQRYIYDKLILGGTSAGAMAMSTPMIYAGSKDKQQITGEIKITTGLEFLKDVCIDTHFVDRGRFVRMAQVIATNPTSVGLGIEEDTAIIVREGINCTVIGSGIAIVIEGFKITDSNIVDFGPDERIYIRDLNVKLLSRDCTYQIPQNNPPHI
jgi:cyanophycinase